MKDGDANHVGAIHRYTWKSKLPYRLSFQMETTDLEPVSWIEGRAIGELQGVGRWQLSNDVENNFSSLRLEGENYKSLDEPSRTACSACLPL